MKNNKVIIWIKQYSLLIIGAIILIFGMMQFKACEDKRQAQEKFVKFDQTVAALNDTITKVKNKKGETVFVEYAAEFNLQEFMKTEAYKELDKEKKKYIKELANTKGLLVAAKAEIVAKDSLLKSTNYDSLGTAVISQTDSTICFLKGDSITVTDSTKYMAYDIKVKFNKKQLETELSYSYKVEIETEFTRDKKTGAVTTTYKLSDPNASIVKGDSYLIPQDKKGLPKWVNTTLKILGGAALLGGGFYLGTVTH